MLKLCAVLMAVAIPGAAIAATGTLSGIYTIDITTVCQSIQNEVFTTSGTTDQDQQTVIQTIDNGGISQTTGFIQFTPTTVGALSGTVAAHVTGSKGSLSILGLPGPPASPAVPDMQIASQVLTGTYSLTLGTGLNPGALVLAFAGKGSGPKTYSAYLSQLKLATYNHMNIIGIQGNSVGVAASCSQSGSVDHH